MSKILVKSSRLPLIVEKHVAEKLQADWKAKTISEETIITIPHSIGKFTGTFGDIKGVDITNNNNDFILSSRENNDRVHEEIPISVSLTDEQKKEFKIKSEELRKQMGWK